MPIAVMNAAQRHGELVTDLAPEGARLPKPDVMGVGRPPAAAPIDRAARIIDSRCQREARAFRLAVCLAQHQPASSEVDTSGAALAQRPVGSDAAADPLDAVHHREALDQKP
jgi:hypothetical protein